MRKFLVVGFNTRYIVCSGARAGYEMHAADEFDDVDLCRCAKSIAPIGNWKERIVSLRPDAVILASGFERVRPKGVRVLNNCHATMKKVTNKVWLAEKLGSLGIPHPEVYDARIKYPVIAKPVFGAGGYRNFIVESEKDLPKKDEFRKDFFVQQFIRGKVASVSLISTRDEVKSVAVNESLSGRRDLGQQAQFGYCGNITPFVTKHAKKLCEIAERIIRELRLVGSNGVDFILAKDGIYVIDVNPRFQGSLDTVEAATGINLFDAHVKSFDGILADAKKPLGSTPTAAKLIVFAEKDCLVKKSLDADGIVDVPRVGKVIKKGEPIATAIGTGKCRKDALASSWGEVEYIKRVARDG